MEFCLALLILQLSYLAMMTKAFELGLALQIEWIVINLLFVSPNLLDGTMQILDGLFMLQQLYIKLFLLRLFDFFSSARLA